MHAAQRRECPKSLRRRRNRVVEVLIVEHNAPSNSSIPKDNVASVGKISQFLIQTNLLNIVSEVRKSLNGGGERESNTIEADDERG